MSTETEGRERFVFDDELKVERLDAHTVYRHGIEPFVEGLGCVDFAVWNAQRLVLLEVKNLDFETQGETERRLKKSYRKVMVNKVLGSILTLVRAGLDDVRGGRPDADLPTLWRDAFEGQQDIVFALSARLPEAGHPIQRQRLKQAQGHLRRELKRELSWLGDVFVFDPASVSSQGLARIGLRQIERV